MTLRFALVWALLFLPQAMAQDGLRIEPEVVCWYRSHHKDSLCPKLTHLKLRLGIPWSERVAFKIAYDPGFASKISWHDSYSLREQQLPPHRTWLADYGFRWKLARDWEISVEDWTASTLLPDASGLAFSRSLQDSGWNQTAARLTYSKAKALTGTLIVGLGEGERLHENDSELYLGALLRIPVLPSIDLQLGASVDKNSLNPDSLWWMEKAQRKAAAEGFVSQRHSAALIVDGSYPSLRGLQASVGWQMNRIKGPANAGIDRRTPAGIGALHPTEFLPQAFSQAEDFTRESFFFSASYSILAEYLLAFHMGSLRAQSDGQLPVCAAIDRQGKCATLAEMSDVIRIRSLTYGLGKVDVNDWSFLLESHEESYDRLYELYHFASGPDQRQKSMRVFQARMNWGW